MDKLLFNDTRFYEAFLFGGREGRLLLEPIYDDSDSLSDFVFVEINSRAERILLCSRSEIVGSRLKEKLTSIFNQEFFEECISVFEGNSEKELDVSIGAKDGERLLSRFHLLRIDKSLLLTSLAGSPTIETPDSQIPEHFYLQQTKDELERSRVKLEEMSDFLFNVINAVADPIFVKNEDHRWILLNDAFCNFMGYPREELLGKSDYDFFPKEEADVFWEKDREVFDSEYSVANEESFTDSAGVTHVISTVKSSYTNRIGKKILVGTIRDISDAKRIERDLVRSREDAEKATRAKSEFVANMSHELRTPLNGVIGMAALLRETPMSDTQREYADGLQDCADRLLGIIDEILDFSKIEAGRLELNPTSFKLRSCLSRISTLFEVRAKDRQLNYTMLLDESAPDLLCGDPARLSQVLLNLLENAVKFTEAGGDVQLKIDVLEQSSEQVQLCFRVSDTGIGIPPEKRSLIFESFRQLDSSTTRKYGGTGLGLAIASRIAELMGGRIWIEDREGWSTSFSFSARLAVGDVAVEAGAALLDSEEIYRSQAQGKAERSLRILLVEDSVINQKVAVSLLERDGHSVEVANHGVEALDILERESFDLLFMDIQMPVMDGFEATKKIRIKESNAAEQSVIIAMTAYATKEDREKCLIAGMNDYVSKPVTLQQLRSKLNKFCSGVFDSSGS